VETLTAKEYAGLRGCTVQYARKLIMEGKIKATEVARMVLVIRSCSLILNLHYRENI